MSYPARVEGLVTMMTPHGEFFNSSRNRTLSVSLIYFSVHHKRVSPCTSVTKRRNRLNYKICDIYIYKAGHGVRDQMYHVTPCPVEENSVKLSFLQPLDFLITHLLIFQYHSPTIMLQIYIYIYIYHLE